MNFKDKLQYLLERDKVSVPKLSEATEISSQTIYSILKRDSDKTKLSHIRKLCDFFNVSMDYLVDDEITDPNYGIKPGDVVGADADIDAVDMINAEVGWDDDDIAFVQAYQAMSKETRKIFRDSLRALVSVTVNMQ